MTTRTSSPHSKQLSRFGALAALVALSLGTTNAAPAADAHFVAKTNTLTPTPIVNPPVAPVIEETVEIIAAEQVEIVYEAPIAQQAPRPVMRRASYGGGGGGGDFFARLRACESGGNYSTNTGNGYYGAYQYDQSTWNNYGGYSTADQAPASVQDQKAQETYAARGASPWPTCGR